MEAKPLLFCEFYSYSFLLRFRYHSMSDPRVAIVYHNLAYGHFLVYQILYHAVNHRGV